MWLPDKSFFASKTANWKDPGGELHTVKWELSRIADPSFPIEFYQCKMEAFGLATEGYGVSPSDAESVQKAFGEAWERIWMLKNAAGDRFHSSNGYAAGRTNEEAEFASRAELLERSIFLKAWSSKIGWQPSRVSGVRKKFVLFALKLKGWDVRLFDIGSNLGSVKACLALSKFSGAIFDTTFCVDKGVSEDKVLMAVLRNTLLKRSFKEFSLPMNGTPEDHEKFYTNPANNEAFDFLLKASDSDHAPLVLENSDEIRTNLIVEAGTFPAVARSENTSWPRLTWGEASIVGENQWPHPLA